MTTLSNTKAICVYVLSLLYFALAPASYGQTLVEEQFSPKDNLLQVARAKSFRGDVIIVKGGFSIFSTGLDSMAAKLRRRGVSVSVKPTGTTRQIVAQIVRNQRKYGPKPVVLVGHSWGANDVISIARALSAKKIRVNYLASFAATNPKSIPRNVRHVTNFYFKEKGWGRSVRRGKGMSGRIENIDMSKSSSVNHFNIDENSKLQRRVIRNIIRTIGREKRS